MGIDRMLHTRNSHHLFFGFPVVWMAILLSSFGTSAVCEEALNATRYRLLFPGHHQGEVMHDALLQYWVNWLRERDYDVAGFLRTESYVDVVLRGESLDALRAAGFLVLEREESAPLAERETMRGVPVGYADPFALESFLISEAADHPTLTSLTVIGEALQGAAWSEIYAMEISNNPGVAEDKPAILLNGLHHAREVVTPHIVMDAITYLTDEYAAGNPQVVQWVNNYKIYCVPMVNPDGSNHVHTVSDLHRKNMRPGCASNPGVDLNRNYPYHWGTGVSNCERSPTGGSSGSTCSDAYRGTSSASEPETQVMIDYAAEKNFLIAVSYHSYGRFIDYPYACNDGNPDERMPEHDVIHEIMNGTAAGIASIDGVNYDVYSPIAIGPVNGDDTSWYYANAGTYALIIEAGTSFQPTFSVGMQEVSRNRGGWQYLLGRMGGARIDVRVADHLTGLPLVAQVELLNFVFDTDELPRNSEPQFGRSRWLVPANRTYTVRVSAPGYQSRTLPAVVGTVPLDLPVLLLPVGAILGDPDVDGDFDMRDYFEFHRCLGESMISVGCRVFDFTADESVTLSDYDLFEPLLTDP